MRESLKIESNKFLKRYIMLKWSDSALKGTVVNRTCNSSRSLGITPAVPLNIRYVHFIRVCKGIFHQSMCGNIPSEFVREYSFRVCMGIFLHIMYGNIPSEFVWEYSTRVCMKIFHQSLYGNIPLEFVMKYSIRVCNGIFHQSL